MSTATATRSAIGIVVALYMAAAVKLATHGAMDIGAETTIITLLASAL